MFTTIEWSVCYISEAHAIDEWPVSSCKYTKNGEPICVKQTKNLESRIQIASSFSKEYGFNDWNILISEPHNNFFEIFGSVETFYKPWPFRIYGICEGIISFISEPKSCETRIDELRDWIDTVV